MQNELFDNRHEIGEEVGALERWCTDRGYNWIVGVDEAGRGPLAGPVHAAAVALDVRALDLDWISLLDDSKKLDEEAREEAFARIREESAAFAIASAPAEEIDRLDILQAARSAMRDAVLQVCSELDRRVDGVFVDGDSRLDVSMRQRTLVSGDARSYAIAAASILAKVSRDRLMEEFGTSWPAYEFASNKGYPTPVHRRALEEHGPSPIHRRTFSGVSDDGE